MKPKREPKYSKNKCQKCVENQSTRVEKPEKCVENASVCFTLDDGDDDMAGAARLLGVKILFTTDAENDA